MAIENQRPCSLPAIVAAAFSAALAGGVAASPLIITGGALQSDTESVYRAFIDALPAEGPVGIIPAASGSPVQSATAFKKDLARYGLSEHRIHIVDVAIVDDRSTTDVDESAWRRNAWQPRISEPLANAAGFWFTGGDQSRIVETLREPTGEASPLLALLRERARDGAVVGGTSAGAAIMSVPMITDGDSLGALLEGVGELAADESNAPITPLSIGEGLGFLSHGVVDQHFDRRARLGRLVRAMAETGETRGYGIDENTALKVDEDESTGTVLGAGGVTVIDASVARFNFEGTDLVSGVRLHLFPAGASFDLKTLEPLSDVGSATIGNEYNEHTPFQGGGMALANSRLEQMLGHELLDNGGSSTLLRSTVGLDGDGLVYKFVQDERSQGFVRLAGSEERYTLLNVRLDIQRLAFERRD